MLAATPELSASLGQLADDHYYLGQLDASDSVNRQTLVMNRQLYGDRHPRVADILINLGATQQDRGRYAEAEKLNKQALELIRAFYGEDHFQTADALTKVARALVFENKFSEGVPMLQRALAIRERVFGPMHPMVASTLNELGNVQMFYNGTSVEADKVAGAVCEIADTAVGGPAVWLCRGVAQLVEHWSPKPAVGSSSPPAPAIFPFHSRVRQ